MNQFTYLCPTKVYFGEGITAEALQHELPRVGKKVMLAYGGGSVKTNGIYDEIKYLLIQADKEIVDFEGIMPNPTYAKVQEGVKLAKRASYRFYISSGRRKRH